MKGRFHAIPGFWTSTESREEKRSPAKPELTRHGFDREQLERDLELSALLAADTHLVVSTGRVSESTEEQARQLAAARGLDLLVLDDGQPARYRLTISSASSGRHSLAPIIHGWGFGG